MVRYESGEIVIGELDDRKVLSKKMIEKYDYKAIKKDFDDIVELLEMNMMFHSEHKEKLKYEVNDNLEFKIFVNPDLHDYTLTTEDDDLSESDTGILTMDKTLYEHFYELCELLLIKIHKAWKHLNEVEKFIIKSLEFDNPPSTDEDLEDVLMYCNKKYYQYKKSGFIKIGTQLRLEEARGSTRENFKKQEKKLEEEFYEKEKIQNWRRNKKITLSSK